MVLLGIVASILGFVLLFVLAQAQRNFFGVESAFLLSTVELGAIVAGAVVGHLWNTNRRSLGASVACLSAAIGLAFLGWFVYPDQVYSRALERVSDWERVLREYKLEHSRGHHDSDAAVRHQRLLQEMAARRSEYNAAEIRYTGDPEYFRSTFFTWSLWLISTVFAAFGVRYLRQHIQQARSRRDLG